MINDIFKATVYSVLVTAPITVRPGGFFNFGETIYWTSGLFIYK